MGGYKRTAWQNLNCLLQTCCHLSTNQKLSVSWQFFDTYGVINYGRGWRRDVVNQCLELGIPTAGCNPHNHWLLLIVSPADHFLPGFRPVARLMLFFVLIIASLCERIQTSRPFNQSLSQHCGSCWLWSVSSRGPSCAHTDTLYVPIIPCFLQSARLRNRVCRTYLIG